MLSIGLSNIAFFVASFFVKRRLDDMDIPKTMTRSIVIFVAAVVVSYGSPGRSSTPAAVLLAQ
jgi:hypothetical protein